MFGRHVEGLSRLLASTDEDRLDVSARGDPRGHHGELERIDQHITLADHRVEGVRPGPFLLVLAKLPGAVGDGAIDLGDEGEGIFRAEAEGRTRTRQNCSYQMEQR